MSFVKGLNGSYFSNRGPRHAQVHGCSSLRIGTVGGITEFAGAQALHDVVSRCMFFSQPPLIMVTDTAHAFDDTAFWTPEVLAVVPEVLRSPAAPQLVELWNEPWLWKYETGGGLGGSRPVGASGDYTKMVTGWKAAADALVADGRGVKLTMATEGKVQRRDGSFTTNTMTIDLINAYAAAFGGYIHAHPAFGGWVLHTYTGDPNALGKIDTTASQFPGTPIWITECGGDGQMGNPVNAAQESAAIAAVYAKGRGATPKIAGAWYYNQQRVTDDTSWQVGEALSLA